MPLLRDIKSNLGDSRLRAELYVRAQQIRQHRGHPRLVMFLDAMHTGSAGDLRGRALAPPLRELGWRVVVVPPSMNLDQRRRILASEQPDVIFLRQSRHPLNRPSYYAPTPCVFDADDADIDEHPDEVLPCLKESVAAVAGSRYLADLFRPHQANVTVIWTGTYLDLPSNAEPNERRSPIIACAQSAPSRHPLELAFVRDVLLALAKQRRFEVHLYGEAHDRPSAYGDISTSLQAAGVEVRVFGMMPYRRFIQSLSTAAIGLNPICIEDAWSRGKSFGKVLAYMAAGVAVVTSPELEYPLFFENGRNGVLAGSAEEWVTSCARLLEHPDQRGRIAAQARSDMAERLSSTRAAQELDRVLRKAVDDATAADTNTKFARRSPGI